MSNYKELSRKDVYSCLVEADKKMHTLFCIRDNLTILSDGLALKEDSEGSNAIQLCVTSLDEAMGELSEILVLIENMSKDKAVEAE